MSNILHAKSWICYSSFSHDVTKIQTKKYLLLLFIIHPAEFLVSRSIKTLNFWKLPLVNRTIFSEICKGQHHEICPNFFKNFFLEVFFLFNLALEISWIFCQMVCISEIQQFSNFLEAFLEKSLYHMPLFLNLQRVWSNGSQGLGKFGIQALHR